MTRDGILVYEQEKIWKIIGSKDEEGNFTSYKILGSYNFMQGGCNQCYYADEGYKGRLEEVEDLFNPALQVSSKKIRKL